MDEKMMILKMLQDGKITSEEALKLLEAIDKPIDKTFKYDNAKFKKKFDEGFNDFSAKAGKAAENMEQNSEKFADDFARRVESVSTDISTAALKFADKMMKYFNAAVNSNESRFELSKTYNFEIENKDEFAIDINASNFNVRVEAGEVDQLQVNILANSFMQNVNIDDCLSTLVDGSKHNLVFKFPDRTWGKIDITVPKNHKSVNITTSNAKCELVNIKSEYIKAVTSNGKIEILGCASKDLEAMTDNSKIVIENSMFTNMSVRTSNSKIELIRSKADHITAKTSNGSIVADGIELLSEGSGKYSLYTSNGKIDLKLNPSLDCGYMVEAHTTMGNVNLKLPGLVYTFDKKDFYTQPSTVIKNNNYDLAKSKLDILADTSNASIVIQG